jgi:phenylalanyl-tRNA synthetase beta chain
MLASIAWLKEYVDIDCSPEELAERLTRVGLEVESVNHLGEGLKGVITGKVEQIERHPNSDHLWICQMNLGQGDLVQILTGAQNVHQYDMVPVAVVGSVLPPSSRNPNGMKLKKAKMRGLDSFGMLCSADELGIDAKLLLPEQRNGIFILPPDTPIGVDIKKILGLDDVVLDIDLTANKQDCFCITGLAREAAAVLGKPLRLPDMTVQEAAGGEASSMAKVEIKAQDLCSRFAIRVLKNIKIKESPEWMQQHLRACGMRPINNVVDVTNYVMLELGQPMHAYDYDTVGEHTLIVRRGQDGEKLMTLDNQERSLDNSMITIADPQHAIGLGGVMGGLETEVTDKTVNVMLESASFDGPSIRRTSKALGLRSEASGRFERGVDIVLCHNALNRAAHLLEQMDSCETVHGIVESYPVEYKPAVIKVTPAAINIRIGVEIPKAEMISILEKLEFKVAEEDGALVVTAPSWRQDVTCDADISEEIARMHSYDKIEAHNPVLGLVQGKQDVAEDVKDRIEDYLAAAGLNEVVTYTFVNNNIFDKLLLAQDDYRRKVIEIMNPLSDDFKVMRTSMVPSLLATAAYNLARQLESVKIFEVGRVFLPKALPLKDFPEERRILSAVMSGRRDELSWTHGKDEVDFYDMKGVVEGLLEKLQVKNYELVRETQPYYHPGKSCAIKYEGRIVGYFGALHPTVADNFNVPAETYVLELEVSPLVAAATAVPQYTHLPKFPGTSRDIAVVVPAEVTMKELEGVIRANAGKLLQEVRVFDVYTGKQVAEGSKSMAFNLTFQAADRTLTDAEIDQVIKNVVAKVGEEYQAQLRK